MSLSYMLVAVFVVTGDSYIERDRLSLQSCAAHAAMARANAEQLFDRIGVMRFLCIPEVRS